MIQIRLKKVASGKKLIYYIVVVNRHNSITRGFIEKLGFYTPHPNKLSNKYVFIDVDRLAHWIARGATVNSSLYLLFKDTFDTA